MEEKNVYIEKGKKKEMQRRKRRCRTQKKTGPHMKVQFN